MCEPSDQEQIRNLIGLFTDAVNREAIGGLHIDDSPVTGQIAAVGTTL